MRRKVMLLFGTGFKDLDPVRFTKGKESQIVY
jgi:hypothetical protein